MPVRLSSPTRFFAPVFAVMAFVSCSASSTLTTAQTDDALLAAQCTLQADRAAAQACFDTFNACKTANPADETGCWTALDSCLPKPPRGDGQDCPNMGDGGIGHGGHGGPDGDGPGGPGGRGGPGGPGGRGGHGGVEGGPLPDSTAVTACKTALTACIAAATETPAACQATEHTCIHDAFAAAFAAECASATATCAASSSADCARLTERCNRGIDDPPPPDDGGTACGTATTSAVP